MFLANKLNKGAGAAAAPADAQFNYVTMLLHGDGTNGAQNNTFLDSSTNNFTITRNGNTTQGSFSPYGSNWSNYFGSADYLSLADNANLNPSTQDFVMEAWVYLTGTTGNNQGFNGKGTPGTDGYTLFVTNALVLSFVWNGTGGATITGGTLVLNTWNHVAVVRNSSVIRLYLNGVGAGSSTACTTDITSTATKFVGQARGGNPMLGYMSNYRMTKGSRPSGYDATSSTLTVPTTPLTAISGTSLLTCADNRFIDDSTNNFTITVTGTPSVQRFNPFGASTAYDTSVIGGSGYFDGSGDSLSLATATALGTGNVTVEFWFYPTDISATYRDLYEGRSSVNSNTGFAIFQYGQTIEIYGNGLKVSSAASAFPANAWTHFAVVRTSGTCQIYINGVASGSSGSYSDNFTSTVRKIGDAINSFPYIGYISNLREVTSAVYSATFTPPTAPVTAISGTSLLTNFTNGAIFDNAMMNNLETVGNAQISTSVVKYGTGSLYMNASTGDTDYFIQPASQTVNFSTGNFTIEFWLNPLSIVTNWANGSFAAIMDTDFTAGTGTNWWVIHQQNDTIAFGSNSALIVTSSSVLSANVWQHVVIVRSGSTITIYVNGTSAGSATYATTIGGNRRLTIGAQLTADRWYKGYIDDLRITKGYARYTSNFTPPTAAFPNIGPV
jgi:hypothetical protein